MRGKAIGRIGRLVEDNKEALARLLTREIGKPYPESLGEVQEVIDTCDFFVSEGRRLYGQTVPSELPDKQLFTFRNPVGVAAIITAGNFPVAVPSWYLVPALLCGNAVVWKPAEYAPALGQALTELFLAGGLPDGVLNLVQCDGPSAFEGLERALTERLVDKVGFTGSSEVGSRIGELCGRHVQSPCLELGGKNPLVVMPDADLDLAAEGSLFSGFGTAGQRCTSLGTVLVHESVHDEFMRRFTGLVEEAAIGDPFGEVLYGPMIHERFNERFLGWLELIRDHHSISGLERDRPHHERQPARRLRRRPRRRAVLPPDDRRRRDRATTTSTAPRRSGRSWAWPASATSTRRSSWPTGTATGSRRRSTRTTRARRSGSARAVSAGMVSVNNSTSGAEAHLPFGGNGKSGNGSRQSGIWVLDQFTRWQSLNWDYAGKLQKAQMDVAELTGDAGFRLAWD